MKENETNNTLEKRRKNMTIYIIIIIPALMLLYLIYSVVMYHVINIPFTSPNEEIVRETVPFWKLFGRDYIVCTRERTTGYDYSVIRDKSGIPNSPYVLIVDTDNNRIGSPPLPLEHELSLYNPKIIFYVMEKREIFYEEIGEYCTEYVVDGWDIPYPMRRGFINVYPKYVLKSDLYSTEE